MVKRPKIGTCRESSANRKLPTFEQYLRQTLDTLFSALGSGDFLIGCNTLAELADNLNNVDVFDIVVQMNEKIMVYADAMRSADAQSWAWYLNSLGTALSKVKRFEEAITTINDMFRLGESLIDEDIQSTALQNLGVINHNAGEIEEARSFYIRALEIMRRIGDRHGQAQILNNLASMAIEDRKLDEAQSLLETSISIKRRFRDKEELLPAYMTSGNLAVAKADYREARKFFSKTLRIAESIDNAEDMALSHLNLGNVMMELGDADLALSHYRSGLEITEFYHMHEPEEMLKQALAVGFNRLGLYDQALEAFLSLADTERRLGEAFDEAMAYHDAAVVSTQAANLDAGLKYYDRAIKGFRRANDVEWEARSLWEKASLLAHTGRIKEASRTIRRPIRILRRSNRFDVLPQAYAAASHVLFQAGLVDRVISLFKEESLFLKKYSDPNYRARRLNEVGVLLLDYGRPRKAASLLSEAVFIHQQSADPTLESLARSDLASARIQLGQLDRAKQDYEELLVRADREDDRVLRLLVIMNLAEVERALGTPLVAVDLGLQSVQLAEQLNDVDSLALIFNNLGLAYKDTGDIRKARYCFIKSVNHARRLQDFIAEARALTSLGNLSFEKEQYEKALQFYNRALDLLDNTTSVLKLDLLEVRLICLIELERDDEASITAHQCIEVAERFGDFERAEDITRRIALANLERGELQAGAETLIASFVYASRRGHRAAIDNIATWAVLLRNANQMSYGREGLYAAMTLATQRVVPEHADFLREMLDLAVRILDE